MFIATGLLSSSSLSAPQGPSNVKESPPTFASNGLLGIAGELNVDQDSSANPAISATKSTPVFTSNGLLGTTRTTRTSQDPSTSTTQADMPAPTSTSNGLLCGAQFHLTSGDAGPLILGLSSTSAEVSESFISNGLLSNAPSDERTPTSHSLFSPDSTQDFDDLPSVSDAFGIKPIIPQRSSATTISVPRSNVRATTFDGKTIYLRRKPKIISPSTNASTTAQKIGNLLDVPIHRLMDQLSSVTAANLQRMDQISIPGSSNAQSTSTSTVVEDMLWVDRYRPRKFTDLLGNERVARDAMTWVKQWDYCVFGISKGKKRARDSDENIDLQDELRRPMEKILLLSGPPGLGKTTLAHVVARQAGYEVMEINASDARSGSIVDDRIRPALESGYAVGSTKPVLLVIDEIDGATGAGDNTNTFVHKLVQLIQTRSRKRERTARGRDTQNKRTIRRPIICICNDHNASSLAKLRPHAYQIRFHRPADIHLVKRLKEICVIEDLKADSRALSTLVSAAKGDLRGCLNALQFVKTRDEDVTEGVIRKATSGMKEEDSSVQSVLNNLFTPLSKKRVKELGLTDDEEARYVARLSREIDNSGRESTIATGCFGHYATLRRHDANLSRQEQAMEWLSTYDRFTHAMFSDGDFSLNQYLPYTLVPFYPLFQEKGGERVERNQTDWEHLQVTRSNEEIFKTLSRCLRSTAVRYSGDFRHLLNAPILQIEFAPYLNRIVSPPLRPVNSQVIRAQEKALMSRLVDIMSTLELRFVQEKAEDGQLTYRLDPPIDVFITYDGKRASDIAVSRYAVRKIVSAEIDAVLIARDTGVVEKGKRGKHDFFGKSSRTDTLDDASGSAKKRAKTVDTRDIADMPPTDFFGRPITVASASTTKAAVRKNVEKKYRVAYRFLEGNSAAVRKPVKVNMFI
ncbi:hypothetical protein CPB84DRAFT_1761185 [Gymnopilus junonius]|uniref:AAA+ ATPase domain-containing protein n=1 Tax=Gymnopilus junonius TaxID=109634 RepID=A0A9P5TSV3_GYMJU|nr:hypothetical protein CPB84DRAFT_1761185 [Gymnopilus junonius]